MRTGEAFPSTYLKKEDIGDARVRVTIDRVVIEDLQNGDHKERKPVVYFRGKEKGLVLNVGNAQAITEIAGGEDEMDNWSGIQVALYVDRNVTFGGKRVGGIRVESVVPKPKPVPPLDENADDIPF